jgi:hypothetical protein
MSIDGIDGRKILIGSRTENAKVLIGRCGAIESCKGIGRLKSCGELVK